MLENEEQALAYAALLSEESLMQDEQRRASQTNTPVLDSGHFTTPTKEKGVDDLDADMAEAIRQSLESTPQSPAEDHSLRYYSPSPTSGGAYDVPIRVSRKGRRSPTKSASRSPSTSLKGVAEASNKQEMDDLDFALQLSLVEEQSRKDAGEGEEFPVLAGTGKEKGKQRD
jgi:hypothetical protein